MNDNSVRIFMRDSYQNYIDNCCSEKEVCLLLYVSLMLKSSDHKSCLKEKFQLKKQKIIIMIAIKHPAQIIDS
jgi:hypothetical protein